MQPAVRLKDVSKRFGGRWALARLAFELPAGRCLLLTGENGAGKTTLLRLLATLSKPTYGTIELLGSTLGSHQGLQEGPQQGTAAGPDLRRRIGLLTHQTYLYDAQSGRENLRFVARVLGASDDEVEASLGRVALLEHAGRPVAGYSAGMKRRLTLAGLLLKRPELVLLDEPWTQLDAAGGQLLDEIIGELRSRGTTLVIATHDHARGRAVCDTQLSLSGGRMLAGLEAIA